MRPLTKNDALILTVANSAVKMICTRDYTPVLSFPLTKSLNAHLDPQAISIRPRGLLESDESQRHFIPYVVLRCTDGQLAGRVATYNRSGSEKRLHGQSSLGFGGHVDISDIVTYRYEQKGPYPVLDLEETLQKSARRELQEEADFLPDGIEFRGLLALEDSPVSRVHIGVVYACDVPAEQVFYSMRDGDREEPVKWLTHEELLTRRVEFETWSQALIYEESALRI